MKFTYSIVAAFVLLTIAVCASAQETAESLARKLGSETFAEREAAGRRLEKLGAAALPALRASLTSVDLETTRRAIELIERIEDLQLREEVLSATPIRFHFKKTPFHEAMDDVRKQTRLQIGLVESKTEVTIDAGAMPYWRAWREFCKSADLVEMNLPRRAAPLRHFGEGDAIATGRPVVIDRLAPQQRFGVFPVPRIDFDAKRLPDQLSQDDSRSVRVRVCWHSIGDRFLEKNSTAAFPSLPREFRKGADIPLLAEKPRTAVFAVEVRPEPRLEFAALPRVELTKYVDADGLTQVAKPASLLPGAKASNPSDFLVNELQYGGMVQMRPIVWQGDARPLLELHGVVRMEIMARPVLLELRDLLKNVGKELKDHDGVTMQLVKAERKGTRLHLQIRLTGVERLVPKSAEPKVVRIRPGVLGVLGPMDVAIQRLEVRDERGLRCSWLETSYLREVDEDAYLGDVVIETPPSLKDDFSLVLTKEPRRIAVEMPFVVRDVCAPTEVK